MQGTQLSLWDEPVKPKWTSAQAIEQLLLLPADQTKLISFSGGKDSTGVLCLALEASQHGLKNWEVVHSDTTIELPFMDDHVAQCKAHLERQGIKFHHVSAPVEQRFFYTMIGKGIPSPHRGFRWCTDKLKLEPMAQVDAQLEPYIGINGERMGESSKRDRKLKGECDGSNECGVLDQRKGKKRKKIFKNQIRLIRPLLEATACDVWDYLAIADLEKSLLPGSFERLNLIYSISSQDSGNGLRTGCIGCPLVTEDLSLQKLVAVYPGYAPLTKLRSLYDTTRIDSNRIMRPDNRSLGAVKLSWRRELWQLILGVEREVQAIYPAFVLVQAEEKAAIEQALREGRYPEGYSLEYVESQLTTDLIPNSRV